MQEDEHRVSEKYNKSYTGRKLFLKLPFMSENEKIGIAWGINGTGKSTF